MKRAKLYGVILFLTGSACSDDQGNGTEPAPDTSGQSGSDVGVTPDVGVGDVGGDIPDTASPPQLEEGWNIIRPGGDTVCSRGTEYWFAVRPGTVDKVVVDFMGGGACWDDFTCGFANAIFNESLDGIEQYLQTFEPEGIYDQEDPDNPFAGWSHVFVPYCTGDVHWGNAQVTYGSGASEVTINHRGAVNVRAVLDWMSESLAEPDQVFVTGCSAGAYGSIMWAPALIEMYPQAQVDQMGDSGAGIITDDFFQDSFPSWNALDSAPAWIPELDPDTVDYFDLALADLYGRIASHYPDRVFSQYTTAFDDNQTFYFEAMGGAGALEWSSRMRAEIVRAESLADNFYSFIAPGEQHCIIPFANFYTMEADGVLLREWVGDMVAGRPIDSVSCAETECEPN